MHLNSRREIAQTGTDGGSHDTSKTLVYSAPPELLKGCSGWQRQPEHPSKQAARRFILIMAKQEQKRAYLPFLHVWKVVFLPHTVVGGFPSTYPRRFWNLPFPRTPPWQV